ncbi:MAG: phosphate acyltransferase PlsX [Helicobacteraceae bacterium]|jgi:glycerol-3-phosphate acyltransferase PlsX|nr:phosphate acyltransferase PlsX [Helicobacteraceae bacterium]
MIRVSIDAMGGDLGARPIVEGTAQALEAMRFEPVLVGRKTEILDILAPKYHNAARIVEAEDVIAMNDAATDAFKRKESSIFKAVNLAAKMEADAVVSAGHSGATMSLATLKIGRLKKVHRPAIATLMPTKIIGKHTLVLDVGANVDSEPKHLFQSAVMGQAYAKKLLKLDNPRVGLLANGEEDSKGDKLVKKTFTMLSAIRKDGFNFLGNAEGSDVFKGGFDVIVCDGFVGNILLKTSEGVAEAIFSVLKNSAAKSPAALLGAYLLRGAFKTLKQQMDYAEYGGAPLIGVNGCAIISHGKSNAKAIKNAILQAIRFVESNVNSEISVYLERYQGVERDV